MLTKRYLGQIMTEMGWVSSEQLETALLRQKEMLQKNVVTERLERVELVARARQSRPEDLVPLLGQILTEMKFVTQDQLKMALAEQRKSFEAFMAVENEKLGTLIEVGALINSTLNLAEVLNLIMIHANRVTRSVASTLMLMDERTGELVFSIPTGPKAAPLTDVRIPRGKGIAGWVAENEQPLLIPDVKADPRFFPAIDEMSGFETKTVLCVPLKTKSKLIGVLEVINRADGTPFSEQDTLLLKLFSYQAAAAIENARLYEELKIRLAECEALEIKTRDSERRYEDLFDHAPDMYFTMRPDGTITAVNRFGADHLGFGVGELVGKPVWNIVHPDDRCQVERQVADLLGEPMSQGDLIFRKKGKDGTTLWVHERAHTVFDDKGRPHELWMICRDITAEKQAEKERENLEMQLRQTQKMEAIGALAGGIAHDFNNILFPMMGFAEMLKEDLPADSPLQDSVEEILSSAHRARELVKQILAFSRDTDTGVRPLMPQTVLKEVLRLIRPTLPSTIAIRHEIDNGCHTILADPTQVHQLVMNLVTNAFHAMQDDGGVLTIGLQNHVVADAASELPGLKPGRYVRLTVSDTGTGMDAKTQEKIFQPYYTTKPDGKGTGLGLWIVYGIVNSCHGEIMVKSQPGMGTAFTIYLPAFDSAPEAIPKERLSPLPGGTERILLVDDEEQIVRLEKAILEGLGYTVETRSSSVEALEAFREAPERYDLVITDMTMPGMTGDMLAKMLLRMRADIPIILCTGYSERISPEAAEAVGIKGFLFKPISRSDFAGMIRKLLDAGKA